MTVLFEKRINDLRGFLGSGEAALVTDEVNIGYFTGFFHSEGALLVTENSAFLLVDFRYAEAAQKQASGCEVICFQTLSASLTALLTAEGVQCLHAEASHMTVSRYEFFRKKCSEQHVDIVADGRLDKHIGSLRVIKTQDELDKIAKAQQIAEAAYSELLNDVRPGVSERELAARLEFYMKQRGAEA
ncbi:MAG: aminopeptidase P family N-terminal domain-containing protein, partial [Ruminococcus sp.]|nr:aminopeptidase P family N-terminal domain-containing protein [Ruminococcus sp.]